MNGLWLMKHDKKRFPSLTTSGLMRIINFFSIDMWPWLHYEAVWGRWEKGGFCLFVKFAALEQEKGPSCLGLRKERRGTVTTCQLWLKQQPVFVIFSLCICVFLVLICNLYLSYFYLGIFAYFLKYLLLVNKVHSAVICNVERIWSVCLSCKLVRRRDFAQYSEWVSEVQQPFAESDEWRFETDIPRKQMFWMKQIFWES